MLLIAGGVAATTFEQDAEVAANQATSPSTTVEIIGATPFGTPLTTVAATPGSPDSADPSPGADSAAATTTSTTAAPGGAVATTAAPTTSPTTAAPTTTTTPAVATTTTTAPTAGQTSTDFAPIPAATYLYDTDGSYSLGGNETDYPEVTELVAETPNGTKQIQVRDLRDEGGDGSINRSTYRYEADGIHLDQVSTQSSVNGFGSTTTLVAQGDFLALSSDAVAGTRSSGRLEGDGTTADVDLEVTQRNAEQISYILTITLSGNITGTLVSEITARAADLLTLTEHSTQNVNAGGFAVTGEYTATLQ